MAKLANHNLDDFENDYEAYFDKAFNNVVQIAVLRLSTPENSPVYTGYFASSWKARQNTPIAREPQQESDRQRRTRLPWIKRYEEITTNSAGKDTQWGPMPQGTMDNIEKRFKIPRMNFKKGPVYIGNQAYYRQYAMEDGRSIAFIQGEMKNIINNAFQEKPRLGTIYAGVKFNERGRTDYQGGPKIMEASE